MQCPKCGEFNDSSRITCFRCAVVLPQLYRGEEIESELNIVLDESTDVEEIVKSSDCIFLTKLEEIKALIITEEYTQENLINELENVKKETNYIAELLNSFTEEEKKWMKEGISQIEEAYYLFQESISQFYLFLENNNFSLIDEGIKIAHRASKILLKGINDSQKSLEEEGEEEEEKI
ncbi:MAG: hypothetical protein HYU63_04640 [Armatimonadetes bacterium]|nr:hypothetical protein [Armatimonadota bacterium]